MVAEQLIETADLNAGGDRQHQLAAEIDLFAQRLTHVGHHLRFDRQHHHLGFTRAGDVVAAADDAVVCSQRITVFGEGAQTLMDLAG
ncbi:hypothetical protein AK51_32725 [Serratia nematodiphila DZ0503SBS1]|nr:hypothetical protein AK51_32725 [Serratia nematodiphila DZ0503SBS1]